MPWVVAELRGQRVYARADERGTLRVENGRVEIRYQPQDGRLYRAAAGNLKIADPTPLPDDTCGPASEAPARGARAKTGAKKAPDRRPHAERAGTIVYTDGACSGNPGPAGLGLVLLRESERVERYEYLGRATNNIAELTAVLRAFEELAPDEPATVYTDSSYTIGVAQKGWKAKANAELVASLREAIARHGRVELVYVPGHAGVELNERADELARRAIAERGSGRQARAT